jgi:hypothetical protein
VDPSVRHVALDEQDRSLWDQARIREGLGGWSAPCGCGPGAAEPLPGIAPTANAVDHAELERRLGALR